MLLIYGKFCYPTLKLEDHSLSPVRRCLFSTSALPSTSRCRLLHKQPEAAPCRGDRGTQQGEIRQHER